MLRTVKKWIKNLRKGKHTYYVSSYGSNISNTPTVMNWTSMSYDGSNTGSSAAEDKRIVKKPVEVVKEIIVDKPVVFLNDLDKQIAVVSRRKGVLEDQNIMCSDEYRALKYLKSRKKYAKNEKLFNWPVTVNEKIDDLCKNYKLMVSPLSTNYKNIPMEAVDEIEKFSEAYSKVCDDMPEFKLIMDQGGKEQKKDPILLAASPFGSWWYVLGAWDKEVEYVDDLIYHGK